MDQNRVNALLAQVIGEARALGIPVSEGIAPEVKLNRRATGRFGCCIRRDGTYTIELSARLLNAEEQAVRQTLAHEVLHTCWGCANHGARWKGYAARMNAACGYTIARTDTCERLGVEDTARTRYVLVCTRCGTQFRRSRRSRLVEHPERYRCRCGGRLERRDELQRQENHAMIEAKAEESCGQEKNTINARFQTEYRAPHRRGQRETFGNGEKDHGICSTDESV